jgi:hypothetical protein
MELESVIGIHTFSLEEEITFCGMEYQFLGLSGSKLRFFAKLTKSSLRLFLSAQKFPGHFLKIEIK